MAPPNIENKKDLNYKSIFLSASIPDELDQTFKAQKLYTSIIIFVQRILAAKGRIIFGGHPTITPLVKKAAQRTQKTSANIDLFQLRCFEKQAPDDIWDSSVFETIRWFGSGEKMHMLEGLEDMRNEMAKQSSSAIFIGGKTDNRGIYDEYKKFLKYHPEGPVYLLGFMDGDTVKIIKELREKGNKEPNGLTEEERQVIHNSDNIDIIVDLVIDDLAHQLSE
ncbi:MAG: hypothetical protein U5L07_08525 [Desulfobacterales bacterium]|nr:hypothetical protein [Desulfobacterales bacterium]